MGTRTRRRKYRQLASTTSKGMPGNSAAREPIESSSVMFEAMRRRHAGLDDLRPSRFVACRTVDDPARGQTLPDEFAADAPVGAGDEGWSYSPA